MRRSEIIQIAREEYLDDAPDTEEQIEEDYRWPTRQLVRLCGEAEREACRSGSCRLIFDESTEAICTLTLVEGARGYPIDGRIRQIERVLYNTSGSGTLLERVTAEDLDERDPGWRTYTDGAPTRCYVKGGRLYLDRAPSAAEAGATLSLEVWREPIKAPLENEEPEIHSVYHGDLVHWIVHRCKQKRDEDTHDPKGADMAEARFRARFGKARDAVHLERLLESPGYLQVHMGTDYADHHRRWAGSGRERW